MDARGDPTFIFFRGFKIRFRILTIVTLQYWLKHSHDGPSFEGIIFHVLILYTKKHLLSSSPSHSLFPMWHRVLIPASSVLLVFTVSIAGCSRYLNVRNTTPQKLVFFLILALRYEFFGEILLFHPPPHCHKL